MKPGLPLIIQKGRYTSTDTLQRITSAIQGAQQLRVEGAEAMGGTLGGSINIKTPAVNPPDCVNATISLAAGVTALPCQVLQITGGIPATANAGLQINKLVTAGVPTSSTGQYGIVIPENGPKINESWSRLQTQGFAIVEYDGSSGLVGIGGCLGIDPGSMVAVISAGGPFRAVCHYASWNSQYYALVQITDSAYVTPAIALSGANDAPSAGCIIEITGCTSDQPVFVGVRPTRTGLSNFAVLLSPLVVGGVGGCVSDIGEEVTVLASGTGYLVGESLGVVKDSFYAGANRLGPMEIMAIVGVVGGNTQCRVRITGKRGDHKIVKLSDGTFDVFESVEFDEAVFAVTAGSTPGLTAVS